MCDKIVGEIVCVTNIVCERLCVTKLCLVEAEEARKGEDEEEADGIQNEKQELHTMMWGIITCPFDIPVETDDFQAMSPLIDQLVALRSLLALSPMLQVPTNSESKMFPRFGYGNMCGASVHQCRWILAALPRGYDEIMCKIWVLPAFATSWGEL